MTRLITKSLRVLTNGAEDQNFLGSSLIPRVLDGIPAALRPAAAKYALAISPHYYGAGKRVEAEHLRLRRTRKTLIDCLVRPYLEPDMSVIDFGCGPGYAAYQAAPLCAKVSAVDISQGAVACAEIINARPNLSYHCVAAQTLQGLFGQRSTDLIFSFAVLQHLSDEQARDAARQWQSVLRPEGYLLCHVPLTDNRTPAEVACGASNVDGKRRHRLRFQFRSSDQLHCFAQLAGFRWVDFVPVADLCEVDDDIQGDHLMICRK